MPEAEGSRVESLVILEDMDLLRCNAEAGDVSLFNTGLSAGASDHFDTVAFHVKETVRPQILDDFDVTEWLLYANPSPWAGRGLSQGEGRVFTQDGRLVATYGVQAMVRKMAVPPETIGGPNRAM